MLKKKKKRRWFRSETLLTTGWAEAEEEARGTQMEMSERRVRGQEGKPEECGTWRQRGWVGVVPRKRVVPYLEC